jgi:hypothetical protein
MTKFFSGTEQVFDAISMDNRKVVSTFGALVGKKSDSFSRLVGFAKNTHSMDRAAFIGAKPITRVIDFKSNPSLHKCDARCRHAKGNCCECSCGGKFHGAGEQA